MRPSNKPNIKMLNFAFKFLHDSSFSVEVSNQVIPNFLRRKKLNQVIISERKGKSLIVIVSEQKEVIAIIENVNEALGDLLFLCEIHVRKEEKSKVEPYSNIRVDLKKMRHLFGSFSTTTSLGRICLLAFGVFPENLEEPHHTKHAIINMKNSIENLTREEHAPKNNEFKKITQVHEYIKKEILLTDNMGYRRFINSMIALAQENKKYRGIKLKGIDPVEFDLSAFQVNPEKIELSKL